VVKAALAGLGDPMSTAKWLAMLAVGIAEQIGREVIDLVKSKPKAPPAPSYPLSHKDVSHQQAQIKAGARKF
jgi:hypothetical protein